MKQYKKLMEYDEVELEFQPEALEAIADKAIERNIGAGPAGRQWRVS